MQNINYIPQTDSTNNLMKKMLADGVRLDNGYTIYTFFQTAGRGQAGNSWESEKGKNLLFTMLLRPTKLRAAEQFRISMLVPLALVQVVNRYLLEANVMPATIKWPNDIYVSDKKLSGILIENQLAGDRVDSSIVGVGLNVNQQQFLSSAPNPVSLMQLIGNQLELDMMMREIAAEIINLEPLLERPAELKHLYMQHLYRKEGWYMYAEREVSIAPTSIMQTATSDCFLASIADVDEQGQLCLQLSDGSIKKYHFKQIRYVIK